MSDENAPKLFTIAGTSFFRGRCTYRFATGSLRVRQGILARHGDHTEIDLRELPEAMTRAAAIDWLREQGIEGELPVTGRAGALTEEQREAIRQAAEAAAAELVRQAEEQAAADMAFIENMGK